MAAPYLVEIRTGGQMKQSLREIIYDVSDEFNVYGAAEPRAVPHITLFGPYNTNRGKEVKATMIDVLERFTLVPYEVDGFDSFPENNVIYAHVEPSPELCNLRRTLSREIRPLTYNYRPYDSDRSFDFHITIAFKDVGRKFDEILRYVNNQYDPQFEAYATRVTSLRNRSMMWEYDLVQDRVMRTSEATSAASWERTERLVEELEAGGYEMPPDTREEASGLLGSLRNLLPRRGKH